jgi:putative membrane protein
MKLLLHVATTAAALLVADWALDGVVVSSLPALLLAALALGLVNGLVRPLLVLLTLPLTVVTLGLFYLVVNGVAFALAAALVPGFSVTSLGSAILAALVVALVSWIFGAVLRRPD